MDISGSKWWEKTKETDLKYWFIKRPEAVGKRWKWPSRMYNDDSYKGGMLKVAPGR